MVSQPLPELRPAVSEAPKAPVLPVLPPRAAPAPRPAAPRPATGKPAGQKGWLSDLLQRASEEEAAPKPAVVETTDPLALDIARMVDTEVLEDAWDRFNHGERNAFTRRLYTPQGQQTFDEIRRKYRRDQEFHDTVDRYIAEFERLLEDTGEDRDSKAARAYLASDSGKVYTMLAHASGRVE